MTIPFYSDANYTDLLAEAGSTGCLERRRAYGDVPCAGPIHEAIPRIPRSEWPARIKAKEGRWLEDYVRAAAIPCLNQNGLSYCHAYATATAMMVEHHLQAGRLWLPAPESIGGPITGWRNQGASLDDDLQQAANFGCCSAGMLPAPYSLNPRAWNPKWKQDALDHTITEWFDVDLPGLVFDAISTCCFEDILCVIGLGWWSHAITGPYRILDLGGGRYAGRYRNNWGMEWHNGGWIDLEEGPGTPDLGAFAPRQTGRQPTPQTTAAATWAAA